MKREEKGCAAEQRKGRANKRDPMMMELPTGRNSFAHYLKESIAEHYLTTTGSVALSLPWSTSFEKRERQRTSYYCLLSLRREQWA